MSTVSFCSLGQIRERMHKHQESINWSQVKPCETSIGTFKALTWLYKHRKCIASLRGDQRDLLNEVYSVTSKAGLPAFMVLDPMAPDEQWVNLPQGIAKLAKAILDAQPPKKKGCWFTLCSGI